MRTSALGLGKVVAAVVLALVPAVASAMLVPLPDLLYVRMDEDPPTKNPNPSGQPATRWFAADSSGSGHLGWSQGGATTVAGGYFGRCGSFDGINDKLTYGTSIRPTAPAYAMTIEAWVKPNSMDTWTKDGMIIDSSSGYYLKTSANGQVGAYFNNGGGSSWFTGGDLRPYGDNWIHLVAVCDGVGGGTPAQESIWVNGVKVASQAGKTGALSTSGNTEIAHHSYPPANPPWFKGQLDEVGLYSRALSSEEIRARFNMGPVPDLLYLRMDEPAWSGTLNDVNDSSGNGNHGIAINGANTAANGYSGRAGSFDGSNDYVDCGTGATMNPSDEITLEAWVNWTKPTPHTGPDAWRYQDAIMGRKSSYIFELGEDGTLSSYLYKTGGQAWLTGPNLSDYEGRWVHVAARYDGSEEAIYVNGEKVASRAASGSLVQTANPTTIGYYDYSRYFTGLIDEAGIHGRALTPAEIRKHATPIPNRLYLEMDEASWSGAVDEVRDSSGLGNHGRAMNGPTTVGTSHTLLGRVGDFDGVNDYVDCGNDTSLNPTTQLTLDAWINLDPLYVDPTPSERWKYNRTILSRKNCYILQVGYGGELNLHLYSAGGSLSADLGVVDMNDYVGEWVHVAATYDGLDTILYFNGSEVARQHFVGSLPQSTAYSTIVGWIDYSRFFDGRIDRVGIYDWALSADQIRLRAYVPEPTSLVLLGAGLLALWRRRRR